MRATWPLYRRLFAVAVLLTACSIGFPRAGAAEKEEEQLREQIIKLNTITGEDPLNARIAELVEDKTGTKKLLAVAVKMAKEKDSPLSVNTSYALARTAQRLKDYDTAEVFYRLNAEQSLKLLSAQRMIAAYGGLIDTLNAARKFEESEKVCQQFLEVPSQDPSVRQLKMLVLRRMVQIQARLGKIDTALKTVDSLIKAQPENWLTRELKGQVLREAGKFDEAAKIYEDVLERINKDDRLEKKEKEEFAGDIRYALSGVYVDLKKIDKAAEHLKALLAREADNPTYNNDLGFIWADHDMNLEEAEKLIRKAIDEDRKLRKKANPNLKPEDDRDSSAYLDSLGWVLYKQKKYKEALKPILEAIKAEEGQHIEIFDHLGDIYLALEQKDKAIEAWKKGLECKPLGKRDEQRKVEVEKKIKKHEQK